MSSSTHALQAGPVGPWGASPLERQRRDKAAKGRPLTPTGRGPRPKGVVMANWG
jgi:hypothetical protein